MTAIIFDEITPDRIKHLLQAELKNYNHSFFGSYHLKNFSAHINNDAHEIIAGMYGFILEEYATLRIEFFWVKEECRRGGLGARLLTEIEKYACVHGCKQIQISTMEFQGPVFYEKMGYQCIGIVPKWFCDRDEMFFIKKLC